MGTYTVALSHTIYMNMCQNKRTSLADNANVIRDRVTHAGSSAHPQANILSRIHNMNDETQINVCVYVYSWTHGSSLLSEPGGDPPLSCNLRCRKFVQ